MGLKGILGAFIEMPEKEKPKEAKIESKPVQQFNFIQTQDQVPLTGTTIPIMGSEFDQVFNDLLAKLNFPGTDYLEFVQAKNTMGAIPNEKDRYTIAFNALAPTGLTKEIVIDTAGKYMSKIDEEIAKFNEAYAVQYKQKVSNVTAQIDMKVKQMQDLSEQIAKLNTDIQAMKSAVATDETGLNTKKAQFEYAGNAQKQKITEELTKINTYI